MGAVIVGRDQFIVPAPSPTAMRIVARIGFCAGNGPERAHELGSTVCEIQGCDRAATLAARRTATNWAAAI